jgi:glycosyltransferase involved in cell wall biosynthesis
MDRAGFVKVFQQTVPADEVVVVNDGSSAEERAALHDLGASYPMRIIINQMAGKVRRETREQMLAARNIYAFWTRMTSICLTTSPF